MDKNNQNPPQANQETEVPTRRRRRRGKKHHHVHSPYASVKKHAVVKRKRYNHTLRKLDSILSKRDREAEHLYKMAMRLGKFEAKRNKMFKVIVGGSDREKTKETLALKLKAQTKSESHLKRAFLHKLKGLQEEQGKEALLQQKTNEALKEFVDSLIVLTSGGFANKHNLEELHIE